MPSHNGHTPPTLSGCSVLPPMEPATTRLRLAARSESKPKGSRRGDRFRVLNTFTDFTLRSLRRNEIAVWLVLYRDTKDGTARTSQADIARRAGVTDRTVRRAIGQLESVGLLRIVRRGGINSGASTYRVQPLKPGG